MRAKRPGDTWGLSDQQVVVVSFKKINFQIHLSVGVRSYSQFATRSSGDVRANLYNPPSCSIEGRVNSILTCTNFGGSKPEEIVRRWC